MDIEKHLIIGVHVHNRAKHAGEVQQLLTDYGCNIKTRIGLHEANENFCSPNGVILIEMVGDEDKCHDLAAKLNTLQGIEAKTMIFDHP